jgi:hypothetical protein
MPLLISLLYLLLHIAVIALGAALLWWALKWFGIQVDPTVLKIAQFILALIVIILIVSWFAGALPPRGIFTGSVVPLGEPEYLRGLPIFV